MRVRWTVPVLWVALLFLGVEEVRGRDPDGGDVRVNVAMEGSQAPQPRSGEARMSQVGASVSVTYLLGNRWALALGGRRSWGSRHSPISGGSVETQARSTAVRLGFDRVVRLDEGASLGFGPGLQMWQGRTKRFVRYTSGTSGQSTGPFIHQYSLNPRIYLDAAVFGQLGISVQVAGVMGRASAPIGTDTHARWWETYPEFAAGISFAL
jgi:hypothetical protein